MRHLFYFQISRQAGRIHIFYKQFTQRWLRILQWADKIAPVNETERKSNLKRKEEQKL